MKKRNFFALLRALWALGKFVCVGLDSDLEKIPQAAQRFGADGKLDIAETTFAFNKAIINETKDLVCAYKPNIAFYAGHGAPGLAALARTIDYILETAPDVPIILDFKRADIGNTNDGYVHEGFDLMKADAITVHPYMGKEAMEPFLNREDKGIIVLARTSNPGAGEFQDLYTLTFDPRKKPAEVSLEDWFEAICGDVMQLYERVAYNVANSWNEKGNCLVVAGATYPEELKKIRKLIGNLATLIPGLGFQQKGVPLEDQVEQTIQAGQDENGEGMIINSSRGIIFASKGDDFAKAARRETQKLHDLITKYRRKKVAA